MKTKLSLLVTLLALLTIGAYGQAATGFTKIGSSTTTTYTDSTCANQTTCYYQVTAVDSVGHESLPASCGASVLCFGGNQAVATMPSSGTHTVALSWAASLTTGATYNVYRAVGPLPPSTISLVIN
jgi:fibronectin type 3 domain-containing protein